MCELPSVSVPLYQSAHQAVTDFCRKCIKQKLAVAVEVRCAADDSNPDWIPNCQVIVLNNGREAVSVIGVSHMMRRLMKGPECIIVTYGPELLLELEGSELFTNVVDMQQEAQERFQLSCAAKGTPPSLADLENAAWLLWSETWKPECQACYCERVLNVYQHCILEASEWQSIEPDIFCLP